MISTEQSVNLDYLIQTKQFKRLAEQFEEMARQEPNIVQRDALFDNAKRARYLDGDIYRAIELAKQQIDLNPQRPCQFFQEYSNYYRYTGEYQQAKQLTLNLSDISALNRDVSWHEYRWGSFAEATAMMDRGRDPWGWTPITVPANISRWQGCKHQCIVLLAEAGSGDHFMFSRWIPKLRSYCDEIYYAGDHSMAKVLQRVFKVRPLFSWQHLDNKDVAALPFMSIPAMLKVQEPGNSAYLFADPLWMKYYRSLIITSSPRIGICWSGNPDHIENHLRSMPMEIMIQGLQNLGSLISLMPDHTPHPQLTHLHMETWDQTLAIIDSCDVVVSVDTAVAHAAAAMGKTTIVAVNKACYYCWPVENKIEQSTWYPQAWAVPQSRVGQWGDVLETIREHIVNIFAQKTINGA